MDDTALKKQWIKTIQFLVGYLVAAWTFLQFLEWILNRYGISPNWVDLFLWIFVGLLPSVSIYFHHQERINKKILKLRELIIIPLNILILIAVIYFGFGSSDLGATTKEISYTDDLGELKKARITKEEFRIGIPIYGFKNLQNNDSLSWLRYGIGKLLKEDLYQNKSISPDFSFLTDTSTKIEEASLFNNFYIDGNYKKEDQNYVISVFKRKANNGKVLKEKIFSGPDLLSLIDEITVFVIENSGFVETKQLRYLDFPINEFMSDSLNAIKEYVNGNYNKAVAIDSKFALAYLEYAKQSQRKGRSKLQVQDLADKAYKNRTQLPIQKQLEVHIQRNLAYENYDDAIEQINLQLEVDPQNSFYNNVLFSVYGETQQTNKFFESSKKLFDLDQNSFTGINLATAAMVSGNDQDLINEIEKYEIVSPNLKVFRLPPLLFLRKVKKADKLLQDIKTLYPHYEKRAQVYDSALAYIKKYDYDASKFKSFVGKFRSSYNEQEHTLWIKHNRLIQYVANQKMYALLPGGKNKLATGFINNETYFYELVKSETEKPIGYHFIGFSYRDSTKLWFWKEDLAIQKAHKALEKKDLEKALALYEIALEKNPNHVYLKNILSYLRYGKQKDSVAILKQNKSYAGNYGNRRFWVENNKFYYKRKSSQTELDKLELLPISENQYMDLTRLGTLMAFEKKPKQKMASFSLSYDVDKNIWQKAQDSLNYILKSD